MFDEEVISAFATLQSQQLLYMWIIQRLLLRPVLMLSGCLQANVCAAASASAAASALASDVTVVM